MNKIIAWCLMIFMIAWTLIMLINLPLIDKLPSYIIILLIVIELIFFPIAFYLIFYTEYIIKWRSLK
jgi:hypothetical protein